MDKQLYLHCYGCGQVVRADQWRCPDCGADLVMVHETKDAANAVRWTGWSFLLALLMSMAILFATGFAGNALGWLIPTWAFLGVAGLGMWGFARLVAPRFFTLDSSEAR